VPPEKLGGVLKDVSPNTPFSTHPTSLEAWDAARLAASGSDLICITGSVFLAGELRPILTSSIR
jgi:dihydrofolate synthase/folylpolyglutamate synthase